MKMMKNLKRKINEIKRKMDFEFNLFMMNKKRYIKLYV